MRVIKSFKYAFEGLRDALLHEKNFRIQVFIFFLIILASVILQISTIEWLIILLCSALVLSAEIFNSGIEKLCDLVSPEIHPIIKRTKDFSAAAVLLTIIISIIIGCIIFIPKIIKWIAG